MNTIALKLVTMNFTACTELLSAATSAYDFDLEETLDFGEDGDNWEHEGNSDYEAQLTDSCESETEKAENGEDNEESLSKSFSASLRFDAKPSSSEMQVTLEQKREAVNYWLSGRRKNLTLNTVKSRFRFVTSKRQLYRFKEQVEAGGNKLDKLKRVREFVLNEFRNARRQSLCVHDCDIIRWALKRSKEVSLPEFKASASWCTRFKRAHNIVSRKITHFVTRRALEEEDATIAAAMSFVKNCTDTYFGKMRLNNIYNTDQSGFNLEVRSGRTLAVSGIKVIPSTVQSVNATTHSYTIQPTISAAGDLLSPLFIVLQELGGDFGPRVREALFTAPNLYVRASTSGKLTKELMQDWFRKVYFPEVSRESVLIIDSWTTYTDRSAINVVTPKNYKLHIETIPPSATRFVQPLDVFFFGCGKILYENFPTEYYLTV